MPVVPCAFSGVRHPSRDIAVAQNTLFQAMDHSATLVFPRSMPAWSFAIAPRLLAGIRPCPLQSQS